MADPNQIDMPPQEDLGELLSRISSLAAEAQSETDLLDQIAEIFAHVVRGRLTVHSIESNSEAGSVDAFPSYFPRLISTGNRESKTRVAYANREFEIVFENNPEADARFSEVRHRLLVDLFKYGLEIYSIRKSVSRQSDRQTFANNILGVAPSNPDTDVQAICKAWQIATKADAVLLLLKNTYTDIEPWEMFAQVPGDVPPRKFTFANNNLPEYSVLMRECVFVDDIGKWSGHWMNDSYTIQCRQELEKFGAKGLECIPLLKPILSQTATDTCPLVEGAIVLCYRDPNKIRANSEQSLMVMGQLTASSILSSYQAYQRRILVRLNELAEKYLTRVTNNLSELRKDYLREVIQLIKESIHVEGVSIFYRDISETKVECLATTGICDRTSKKIPDEELSNVFYPAGANRTGRCYSTGKPLILTEERIPDGIREQPQYLECPASDPIRAKPAIFYPIPASSGSFPAAGVIRCALHKSTIFPDGIRRFDPMDVQTLGFIARQLAPALHSMDINIRREQTVSITKHDLRTPLQMMQRTLPEVQAIVEKSSPGNLAMKDVKIAIEVALNLVDQLEPDPMEIKEFDPQKTELEGEIVARLKAMLSHVAWERRKMTIKYGSFADIPPVKVDKLLIERALSNLVMNAIKYGERGSEISILPLSQPEGFYINVMNKGLGVSEQDAPHLFKPNFRARRTLHLALGSGIGLTIAKAAMEKHGGKLLLKNLKDPTVFAMFFPRKLIVN